MTCRAVSGVLSVFAVALLGTAACGGADGERDGRARDAADADSVAMAEPGTPRMPVGGDDFAAGSDSAGSDSAGSDSTQGSANRANRGSTAQASDEDPFRGFDLPSENGTGEMRRYKLRLRNDGDSLAIVYADGGAGEVLLDTVPAGSWRPVEVDSRAHLVRLRSVTSGGDLLRETELGVPADTAIDLAIGSPTPAE